MLIILIYLSIQAGTYAVHTNQSEGQIHVNIKAIGWITHDTLPIRSWDQTGKNYWSEKNIGIVNIHFAEHKLFGEALKLRVHIGIYEDFVARSRSLRQG